MVAAMAAMAVVTADMDSGGQKSRKSKYGMKENLTASSRLSHSGTSH